MSDKKGQLKVISIALVILFIISTISLVISLISKDNSELLSKEIGYLIVMVVSFLGFILSFILYKKEK